MVWFDGDGPRSDGVRDRGQPHGRVRRVGPAGAWPSCSKQLRAEDALDGVGLHGGDIDELLAELQAQTGLPEIDEDEIPGAAGCGRPRSAATVGARAAPAAVRRLGIAGGPRPAARRRADPPRQHGPAVQRQGRAALEQRDRRGPQLVRRPDAPPEARPRAAPGEGEADRRSCARRTGRSRTTSSPTRSSRSCCGPGSATSAACCCRARVLHLGRLRQHRQLPLGDRRVGPLLLAGDHLGEAAPGPDAQGLHGEPRVVLLRLEGRRRAQVLRRRTTRPTCGRSRR